MSSKRDSIEKATKKAVIGVSTTKSVRSSARIAFSSFQGCLSLTMILLQILGLLNYLDLVRLDDHIFVLCQDHKDGI